MRNKEKWVAVCAAAVLATMLTGCGDGQAGQGDSSSSSSSQSEVQGISAVSPMGIDISFSARDLDVGYDESTATKIALAQDGSAVTGEGASVSGNTVTISGAGVYLLSGELHDGQIVVDSAQSDKIQLVLDGVSICCKDHAAIYVKQADKVFITLAPDSQNTLSDQTDYALVEGEDNVDGVIFSKEDLTINGSGALTVTANYKHGIVSKDDLVITGGTYTVTANGKGLSGKDCVKIKDGNFTIQSQGDGIQSDNAEDALRGYVYIAGGTYAITAATDGVQAETVLQIDGGSLQIETGGGSGNASTDKNSGWGNWPMGGEQQAQDEDTPSAKGLKAGTALLTGGGTFTLDCSDDALHSNGDIAIEQGTFTIAAGDDGVHADDAVLIQDGSVAISKSYEGVEGSNITINGGEISLTASDDGLNAAGGNDASSINGRPGQNSFAENADIFIRITGGNLTIDASGDGIDSNGALYIDGGAVHVNGPTSDGDGALDYDGSTAKVTGGTVVAVGSAGMAQGFTGDSTQCSVLYNWDTQLAAGTEITVRDAQGNLVLSYTPAKSFRSAVISSDGLVQGETYTISAGDQSEDVALSAVNTTAGTASAGQFGGGPGGPMGGGPMGGAPGER